MISGVLNGTIDGISRLNIFLEYLDFMNSSKRDRETIKFLKAKLKFESATHIKAVT